LRPDGGVHFFVAGSGGAHQRPMHPHPRTLFAKTDQHGIATIEADRATLTVRFVADDGSELYSYTLHKPAAAGVGPTRPGEGGAGWLRPRPATRASGSNESRERTSDCRTRAGGSSADFRRRSRRPDYSGSVR